MKIAQKYTIGLLIVILFCTSLAFSQVSETTSEIPEDTTLMEELKWLQAEAVVYTASKREQNIEKAPSVMTVYTAEDIKRQGLRSVKEILERTVGFFNTKSISNPLIGSRGITTGDNEHFLLLMDGQNMNSIVDQGPGNYHMFPLISHVKRIEIIRGPGSTLWGSDAALGIIHIITKDGGDINGLQTTLDYAGEDNQFYANVLYGNEPAKDQSVMLSFTYAEADGYPKDGFYSDPDSDTKFGPLDKINDSWELYGKMRIKDYTLSCRASDLMDIRLDDKGEAAGDPKKAKYHRRKHYSINLQNIKDLTNDLTMETKVFSHLIENSQVTANPNLSPGLTYVEQSYLGKEMKLGVEFTLKAILFDRHNLLTGFRFVQVEVDPVSQIAIFPPIEGKEETTGYSLLVIPDDEDRTFSAYIEDDWQVLDKLSLIAGVRIDQNTLREKSTKVIPRLGAIWSMAEKWTAKYLYNTGYVRPTVAKSFLGQQPKITRADLETWTYIEYTQLGLTDSEEIYTHDLQLLFNGRKTQACLTGYHTVLKNAFNYLLEPHNVNDVDYLIFYINTNTITSYGLEFDFKNRMNRVFEWYGNFSNVLHAKIDDFESSVMGIDYSIEGHQIATNDGTLTMFPHQIWNLGVNLIFDDFRFVDQVILNLHYRGWADRWDKDQLNPDPVYEKSGPEEFYDTNLLFKGIAKKPLDISIYAKNIGDNKVLNSFHFYGYYPERGCSIGAKVSYTF